MQFREVMFRVLLTVWWLAVYYVGLCQSSNGCVELDHLTFDKIVKRFRYTLVKFDVAFPYGDKHEAFTNLALETTGRVDDILFALVGIRDYGEKENANLGQRFRVPEKYPVIKLFNNQSFDAYVDYPEDAPVDVDALREFINANSELYLSLPGCLKEIDELARRFADPANDADSFTAIITETEHLEHIFTSEADRKSFQMYVTLMRKTVQSAKPLSEFLQSERDRVHKLLKDKISDKKKADLKLRLNIMDSFASPSRGISKTIKTDEL